MAFQGAPERESQQGLLGMQGQLATGNPYQVTTVMVNSGSASSLIFYSYPKKTSKVVGVLHILTGVAAIFFWSFAMRFEWKNNKLGYNADVWYAAPGCWCGLIFMVFPGGSAIIAGIKRTRKWIKIHMGVALFILFTFAIVYLGWSAAALHNSKKNPAFLCAGALRDIECQENPGQVTMYAFSVFLALLEMGWLVWSIVLCGQVICGKGDKHNVSHLGTSLQCGGPPTSPTSLTAPDQIVLGEYQKEPGPGGGKRW